MRQTDSKDHARSYFRSPQRLFVLNGQWFYSTREGDVGPFSSRAAAERDIVRYAKEHQDLAQIQEISARRVAREAAHTASRRVRFARDHRISPEDLLRKFRH
jgi:hypothetical protein